MRWHGLNSSGSEQGQAMGSCEHSNKFFISVKRYYRRHNHIDTINYKIYSCIKIAYILYTLI